MTPGESAVHRDGQPTPHPAAWRPSFPRPAFPSTALTRTLWKELRTLRPLAVAMFALAAIILSALKFFLGSSLLNGQAALGAWFAAALYAVGAAATVLSGEREDETDVFYHVVAAPPRIVFGAKLLATTGTALALVAALLVVVMLIVDSSAPWGPVIDTIDRGAPILLAALAWGFLTATVIRQPLLAALAGIALASLSYQIPLAAMGAAGQVFDLSTMRRTTPAFVGLSLAVLAVAWLLGSRWALPLAEKSRRRVCHWRVASAKQGQSLSAIPTGDTPVAHESLTHGLVAHPSVTRRKAMLARLLWQSWRHDRGTMPAALGIGLALVPAVELPLYMARLGSSSIPPIPVSALFVPALFGALVFRGDHRHGSYQFLDHKVARPRFVWAVRQGMWLSALVTLAIVVIGVVTWLLYDRVAQELPHVLSGHSLPPYDRPALALELVQGRRLFATLVGHASWAILLAFAWGQLCSLVVRREVFAGFLAVLGSIAISAWAILLGFADLGAVRFMGLGALGLLALAWWLAPTFLAARESLADWGKLAAAITAIGGATLGMIPAARMNQVAANPHYYLLTSTPSDMLAAANRDRAAGRAVALRYEQAWNAIVPFGVATERDGTTKMTAAEAEASAAIDKLFGRPDASDSPDAGIGGEMMTAGAYGDPFATDVEAAQKHPKFAEWQRILKEFEKRSNLAYLAANQDAIAQALEISQAQRCWFEGEQYYNKMAELAQLIFGDAERLLAAAQGDEVPREGEAPAEPNAAGPPDKDSIDSNAAARQEPRALEPAENLDAAWRRIIALVRIRAHILQSHPLKGLGGNANEPYYQSFIRLPDLISRWATAPGQTPQRHRAAALDLLAAESIYPTLVDRLLVNYEGLLKVVDGAEPPTWLHDRYGRPRSPGGWDEHLALALQQFPWEQRRARRAAELIAADRLDFAEGIAQMKISPQSLVYGLWPYNNGRTTTALWDENRNDAVTAVAERQQALDRARTCRLVAYEEQVRDSNIASAMKSCVDAQACRRGEVLKLALAAYHLEHDEYPATLDAALADFAGLPLKIDPQAASHPQMTTALLATLVADPYAGKPYGPKLLGHQPFSYVRDVGDGPLYGTRPYDWDGKTIEHGPLLWSVGVSDAQLIHVEQPPPLAARTEPPAHAEDLGPGYVFRSAADNDSSGPILIDLPK